MRTYILPRWFAGEPTVQLNGKDSHYLLKVLRMKEGDTFAGRDMQGKAWDLVLVSKQHDGCCLACTPAGGSFISNRETLPQLAGKLPHIHLYMGLCKGRKLEQIVRQATEIGTARIILVQTAHCVVDFSDKDEAALLNRKQRYEAIVKEALQQSGSSTPTFIDDAKTLAQVGLDWHARGPALLFHEQPLGGDSIVDILQRVEWNSEILDVAVAIGPEGGFSSEEVATLQGHGFIPVHLETNILRSETAALYALAVTQTLLTSKTR